MLEVSVHHTGVLALVHDRVHACRHGRRETTVLLGTRAVNEGDPAVLFTESVDHRRRLIGRVVYEDYPIIYPRQSFPELSHQTGDVPRLVACRYHQRKKGPLSDDPWVRRNLFLRLLLRPHD